MADEPLTIRGINWRQTFAFIHLFRAFRVAVHPSKLVLALVALMLLYAGGHLLDLVWAVQDRAVPNEVTLYENFAAHPRPGQTFLDQRKASRDEIERAYAQELVDYRAETDLTAAMQAAHSGQQLNELKTKIVLHREALKNSAVDVRKHALSATPEQRDNADRKYKSTVREAFADASNDYQSALLINNVGLFEIYFDYESNQLSNMVRAVQDWNWLGHEHLFNADEINPLAASISPVPTYASAGVLQSVVRFFTVGPLWMLTQHPLFFFMFGLMFLVLWSIFGGAICRIAAVHVARDEKLSIRSALMFSGGKFLSFLFAPLIPLMIVVGVGLLVTAGSALANVPYFGPIIVGAAFILVLAAGFVMALVLVGLIGGFNLMYPTVAVEGSDSFDAISRSFSYLYARPWTLGFYTLLSIVYGTISYAFVRLFIFLMLVLAYKFSSLAVLLQQIPPPPSGPAFGPTPAHQVASAMRSIRLALSRRKLVRG